MIIWILLNITQHQLTYHFLLSMPLPEYFEVWWWQDRADKGKMTWRHFSTVQCVPSKRVWDSVWLSLKPKVPYFTTRPQRSSFFRHFGMDVPTCIASEVGWPYFMAGKIGFYSILCMQPWLSSPSDWAVFFCVICFFSNVGVACTPLQSRI